ncbi:hypothetical protein LSS_12262 [Leptospira santarosai serovar Shermani str. LT 821]|uniref:Uncharacterized protein n=1 Tax=Leptospira santarosai serovar Shermani str. LT 821 TaxID=758847 RepID=K8XYT0_9LEPT|nr:hypothetical protein LSS_12262 [Leptospira santarosai serovar Shermani str. LT 821]
MGLGDFFRFVYYGFLIYFDGFLIGIRTGIQFLYFRIKNLETFAIKELKL